MENTESAENNIAFIDGQNLHFGARENGWFIDHKKLRVYLLDKYKIKEAYYFLGFQSVNEQELYDNLTSAGYILMFKEHAPTQGSRKRGNVDSDIIFNLMKKLVDNEPFDRAFIVSGDGDYKKLVDYLITKGKFGKMLFPNQRFASFLYMDLGSEFFDYLENIRSYIEYKKIINEKGS